VVKNTGGGLGGSGKGVVVGMAGGFSGVVEDVAGIGVDGGAGAEGEGRRRCWTATMVRWVAPTTGPWKLSAGRSHDSSWGSQYGVNIGGVLGSVEDGVVKGVDGGARACLCH
jgi:hypothetical protein